MYFVSDMFIYLNHTSTAMQLRLSFRSQTPTKFVSQRNLSSHPVPSLLFLRNLADWGVH